MEEVVIARRVGLIIVDSVACLFRREIDCQEKEGVFERNKLLTQLVSLLKSLAHNYRVVVVAVVFVAVVFVVVVVVVVVVVFVVRGTKQTRILL